MRQFLRLTAFGGDFLSGRRGVASLFLRLVTGTCFIFHGGWQKLGLPHGSIHNALHWGDALKIPPFFQFLATCAEFGGGSALILGLLTPLASLSLVITMTTAICVGHLPQNDPFLADPGKSSYELTAVFLVSALTILLTGPGVFSLDRLIFGPTPAGTKDTNDQGGELPQ